ncbi:MAG: DMT family transporter [Blautia sp.]|nr:DMT family transporter [Blautia sp.]
MNKRNARLLLLSVFIARGTSFLFSKVLLRTMSPVGILAVRFLLAFLILALLFHKRLFHCSFQSLRGGVILGVLYTVCMVFEMFGLRLVDSGVSSLIENMAIVLVPVFAAALAGTLPEKWTMFCAVLAVAGVGFLSLTQKESENGALGILLVILAAVTYAVCIMATETVSRNADPIAIGVVQLGTMGVLSLAGALPTGSLTIPRTALEWSMMLLLVLLCSCFGFAFQPLGQKYLPAEEAAVLTVVNPFTASIMGILIAGESMSTVKFIGYVLILTALVLYHKRPGKES